MNAVTGIKEKNLVRLNVVTGIKTMTQESKKGRGGARANSGMKSSGIETVTVRIDKRLLNIVTEIKADFKNGKSLDDIIDKSTPKHDDAKLLRQIAELELERDNFRSLYLERRESNREEIKQLKHQISMLKSALSLSQASNGTQNNLDEKLRKRLVQFCHPDKHQDERSKAIAVELVQDLNKLGG